MQKTKDVSVKISRKHFLALKRQRIIDRRPIKSAIELAIESSMSCRDEICLRKHEAKVFRALKKDGWLVFRGGWPDFLAVKGKQVKFVEAKSGDDPVHEHQRIMHDRLRECGFTVEVIRTEI